MSRYVLFEFALLLVAATVAFAEGPETNVVIGGLLKEEGGDWKPAESPLSSPFGVGFDEFGGMWIVELEGGRVHFQPVKGGLKQIAGDGSKGYTGDGGPAKKATFNGMHNVAVTPAGDVYISDSWNHAIRRIDHSSGLISTFAGTGKPGFSGDGGAATKGQFDFLMCVTLSVAGDRLYIADLKNRRIREVSLADSKVRTVAGNGKNGVPKDGAIAVESPLVDPRAVTADSKGNVYILERSGHALRKVTPEGKIYTVAGDGTKGFADGPALEARLSSPKHICVDDQDRVLIADDGNVRIRRFDGAKNTVETVLGGGIGEPPIRLSRPHGVAFFRGHIYVVDTGHNRVLRVE